eukprot:TRINITY_DN31462_c0_g1_i1.p1 TRINITY_DN31462_c0_g1~~TRINITY_DN31462_c0_g1_i1.p1  ORF type:complete len:149 (-),score=51.55 TRINITY_DN31462_c0_g1_i1:193-639(-)
MAADGTADATVVAAHEVVHAYMGARQQNDIDTILGLISKPPSKECSIILEKPAALAWALGASETHTGEAAIETYLKAEAAVEGTYKAEGDAGAPKVVKSEEVEDGLRCTVYFDLQKQLGFFWKWMSVQAIFTVSAEAKITQIVLGLQP